jgi:hypothetical protein
MTSIKEEVDYLFFQKKILDTGTQLTLKQPVHLCGLSKGRACMYVCIPTAGHIHLCNFSKKQNTGRLTGKGVLVWKTRVP